VRRFAALGILGVLTIAGTGLWAWRIDKAVDGDSSVRAIAMGRTLYAEHCASCHGANLEGQANWRQRLPNGRMPAPPHDASGHTWHHSDTALFRVTKEGSAAVAGGGYASDMPGFGAVLKDEEIRAVLAFIKSTWPARQREAQARANASGPPPDR
jgi:mono/diheme cytochrome c family protein